MANATVSRLGLVNNSGTNFDELFLKVLLKFRYCQKNLYILLDLSFDF